ncbi:MAG: hypothetical protein J2P17_13215, partial [Mycobacterium sp.]|nr:hypothetical protein [Mycobacterium sp.]
TAVTTVVASDPGGATFTYSIAGGADAAAFTIDPSTGALSFASAPNFETPADADGNNVYDVIVSASDGSLADTQEITVVVTNAAPQITSNGGDDAAAVSVAENTTAVTTVVAADPGAALTYSIAGGADAALFTIDASTGALSFASAPNFETPADAGGNNIYDVIVSASDGSLADTQAISVAVTNVAGVTLTGTNLNDTLTGTNEEDTLNGGAANDTLNGLGGNDTLNGGTGADIMTGGAGNDTYIVDATGDQVIEDVNGGIDIVTTALKAYTLATNVENLTFTGTGSFAGTGNDLDNAITGGAGADTLNGGAGNDFLRGGAGNDILTGGVGNDTVVWSVGDGRDIVDGGDGTDTFSLTGSADSETFWIETVADYLARTGAKPGTLQAGTEIVFSRAVGTANSAVVAELKGIDDINVDGVGGNDTFVVSGDFTGTDLDPSTIKIHGAAGNDTLDVSGRISDQRVVFDAGGGNNTVLGNVLSTDVIDGATQTQPTALAQDTTPPAPDPVSVTDLILGHVARHGGDWLHGTHGNDTLLGTVGDDIMMGRAGSDTFVFAPDFGNDVIIGFDANPSGGQDLVDLSALGITADAFAESVTIADHLGFTQISIGDDTIKLMGVHAHSLTQHDFILA